MDFANSFAWLILLAAMLTLLLTLIGLLIARLVNLTHRSNEPWCLTKLEGNLWLLKRKTPVVATIQGIIIENPENISNQNTDRNSFLVSDSGPAKYFQNGTTTLIRVKANTGSSFKLYYEEHQKMTEETLTDYNLNTEGKIVRSSNIQVWTTSLY